MFSFIFLLFVLLMNFNQIFGQLFDCPIGWQKGEFCGGIFCYYKLPVPQPQRPTAVEQNICQTIHPAAHVVSIHCNQEMQFLVQYGKFVIGLHIRSNEPWTKTGFRWEDGSPLDFDGWDHGVPDQPDNQLPPERNVEFRNNLQRFGWHDLPLIYFEAVVCKITIRPYGQLPPPQNPYNPINPAYPPVFPYPPNPLPYPYSQQQQQTPPPRLLAAETLVPGILPPPNPNILQPLKTAPQATEVIIEPSVISVVTPVPINDVVAPTPPPPPPFIQRPPQIQQY